MRNMKTILLTGFFALALFPSAQASTSPLTTATFAPEQPVQGDQISVYLQPVTTFNPPSGDQVLLTATLDNSTASIPLLHPAPNLWIAQLGPYNEITSHQLSVSLVIENQTTATQLQQEIAQLDGQISTLQDEIKNSQNPAQTSQWQTQLQHDQTQKQALVQTLAGTSTVVGTDNFKFFIAANNGQTSSYPHISSISPSFGSTSGGSHVVITGSNFTGGAQVLIGGQAARNIKVDGPNEIEITTPAVSPSGPKDVEILQGTGPDYSNAILKNGFFAIDSSVSLNPVASVTSPLGAMPIGQPITLNASASYGFTGQTLTYIWHIVSQPLGSTLTDASLNSAPSANQTMFTPQVVGDYLISLTVTAGTYQSLPVLAYVTTYRPLQFTFSPAQLTFEARLNTSQTQTLTITNIGTAEAVQISFAGINDDGQWSTTLGATGENTSYTLQPNQSVVATITYTPNASFVGTTRAYQFQVNATGVTSGTPVTTSIQVSATADPAFPLLFEQIFPSVAGGEVYYPSLTSDFTIPAVYDQPNTWNLRVVNTTANAITINSLPQLTALVDPFYANILYTIGTAIPATAQSGSSVTIPGNGYVEFPITATPTFYPDQSESPMWSKFTWTLGLLSNIDPQVQFYVACNKLADFGTINSNPQTALAFNDTPGSNQSVGTSITRSHDPTEVTSETGNGLIVPNNIWINYITDMKFVTGGANGPSTGVAQDFSFSAQPYTPPGGTPETSYFGQSSSPFTEGTDFILGADYDGGYIPSNQQNSYGQLTVNFKPSQPASAYQGANQVYLQLTVSGLSTPYLVPVTVSPTIQFTENGQNASGATITANVGDTINYKWSSLDAATLSSLVTVTTGTDPCGYAGKPWVANTVSGTSTGVVASCQAGLAYVITLTGKTASGQAFSTALTEVIKPTTIGQAQDARELQ